MSQNSSQSFHEQELFFSFRVSNEQAGLRLDQFLVDAVQRDPSFPKELSTSRSFLVKQIDAKKVLVNGKSAKKKDLLEEGDVVSIDSLVVEASLESALKPESIQLDILYEDEAILVINKAAGMVVHPGAGNSSATLVHALMGYSDCFAPGKFPDLPAFRPGIVHRLDAGTTGVMVIAKNPRSHAVLSEHFAKRRVHKEYLMLSAGARLTGDVKGPIGRDPSHRQRYALGIDGGKESHTTFYLEKDLKPPCQLTRAVLHTGRTHQIRVHAKAMQAPLIGDPLYGYSKRDQLLEKELKVHFSRPLLHASLLQLPHPVSGSILEWTANLPGDMLQVIELLSL